MAGDINSLNLLVQRWKCNAQIAELLKTANRLLNTPSRRFAACTIVQGPELQCLFRVKEDLS